MTKAEYIYSLIENDFHGSATVALDGNFDFEIAYEVLKNLALKIENTENVSMKLYPTSMRLAIMAKQFGLELSDINTKELDLYILKPDYVSSKLDSGLFIKNTSESLIKDKIYAHSARKLVLIKDRALKEMPNQVVFEIASFAFKRTLNVLDCYGKAELVQINGSAKRSETGNLFAKLALYDIFDELNLIEAIEACKQTPGILEHSVFTNFVDKQIEW